MERVLPKLNYRTADVRVAHGALVNPLFRKSLSASRNQGILRCGDRRDPNDPPSRLAASFPMRYHLRADVEDEAVWFA
jgi:hypothetical protein